MAFLIDTIDTSGLFAQSANSATIATKDSNGNDITATYQPIGDYYSASNPSGFITGVPNTYLQNTDLSVTAGMITGISGIPISASGSSAISAYDLSAGANINIVKDDVNSAIGIAVSGLDTYLQNTDLTIVNNKVTEISGVPLAGGGGELPESVSAATDYVTATSGNINDTINNVSSNSGAWGGSALPISAGPGIKVNLVDNTLVFSNDETVLYSGDLSSKEPQDSISLTEEATNFEKLDILYADRYNNIRDSKTVYTENLTFDNMSPSRVRLAAPFMYNTTNPLLMRCSQYKFTNSTAMTLETCGQIQTTTAGIQSTYGASLKNQGCYIYKVVGINRISGGN